jgi:hypothetical protein
MEYNLPSPPLIRLKKFCCNYFREIKEIAIRAILLLVSTTVLSLIVLYFYSILWHIFRMTYRGKKFIMLHPKVANVISQMVNNDLIEISVHTTFSAFSICLIFGAICRVSYITLYFYYSQSIIAKLLFWGVPLTAVVSMYVKDQIEFAHWSHAMPITIVPTLCVFTYCFKFAEVLLPEFGDIVVKIFQGLKGILLPASNQEH